MEPSDVSIDEEAKTALVCEDNAELQKAVISALQELKYAADIAPSAEVVYEKIRFNRYDVVVLDERFAGGTPENNEVLKHFQYMPMMNRRHIFVALIGPNLPTQDNMAAFDKSVNVVINEKDAPNLKSILKRSVADNDQFYKVYKESLIKMGKR